MYKETAKKELNVFFEAFAFCTVGRNSQSKHPEANLLAIHEVIIIKAVEPVEPCSFSSSLHPSNCLMLGRKNGRNLWGNNVNSLTKSRDFAERQAHCVIVEVVSFVAFLIFSLSDRVRVEPIQLQIHRGRRPERNENIGVNAIVNTTRDLVVREEAGLEMTGKVQFLTNQSMQ